MQLFVSASHAQVDMNNRFQAQQNARLALDGLRREIHCASAAVERRHASRPTTSITITLGALLPDEHRRCSRRRHLVHEGHDAAAAQPAVSAAPYSLWRYAGTMP